MNSFVIEHSPEELALTAEFQHRVTLAGITLKSFAARRADNPPEAERGLQLDLKHTARHCGVQDGKVCFDVSVTMDALADGKPDKVVFHVDCAFELVCALDSGFSPTDEHLAAYQRGNAVFLCWPYMREFVQNATSRLGLAVAPIPLLRIGPKGAAKPDASATPAARAPRRQAARKARRPVSK